MLYLLQTMSRPTLENRRKLIRAILNRPLETHDYWEYAVSKDWIDSWREDKCSSTSSLSGSTNADLFTGSQDVQQQVVTMSSNVKENNYVPETVWRMLVSWFGLHSKHLLRRRPMYFSYMNLDPVKNPYGGCHVIADRELDFIPIWVGDINDIMIDKFENVFEVFAWDNFEHIRKQVVRGLQSDLKSSSKVRVWFGVKTVDSPISFEPVFDMHETLLTKLILQVPAVQKLMEDRSRQMNPNFARTESSKKLPVRKPLGEALVDVFSDQVPQVCVGVEVVGVLEKEDEFNESGPESIVTLSSIRNEWDDQLTTILEKHTENTAEHAQSLQYELLSVAKQIVGDKLNEIEEIRSDYEKRFAFLGEREESVRQKENENNEKESELQTRLVTFKRGQEEFQQQKKKLMDDMKRIEDQNKISESVVNLNIGGILYTTSIKTLTKESNSLFGVMFSGQHALKQQPDGTYFIDRDGVNFRYLLNYLRDGDESIQTIPNEETVLRDVLREGKYYQLSRMCTLVQKRLVTLVGPPDRGLTSM